MMEVVKVTDSQMFGLILIIGATIGASTLIVVSKIDALRKQLGELVAKLIEIDEGEG